MTDLRAGVIGLGVGEQHLNAYKAAGCDVIAVCDIDPARLKAVADRHGVSHRFDDYRSVTENADIDVVSICSYDDVHAEQAISALRHGKHVMIEKPIALFRPDAEALAEAHRDSGRLLTSNLILRTAPRFQKVKQLIDQGTFGDIFYMEGDYIHQILHKITDGWRGRMDFYCVLYGGGIHLIDLMRWMMSAEVSEVSGMSNKILTRGTAYRHDDTTVNLLRFDNDVIAKTVTTFGPQRPKFHPLAIYGSKATFINDVPDGKLFFGTDLDDEQPLSDPYPGAGKGELIPDLVAAIVEGREPHVTSTDVFRVMDVCFAAMESLEKRTTVQVDYLV